MLVEEILNTPLVFYHGGRMEGPPSRYPEKSNRYGPGLYVVDDIDTARSYAKGGGRKLFEIGVDPNFRDIQDVKIEGEAILNFLYYSSIRNSKKVIADLFKFGIRYQPDVDYSQTKAVDFVRENQFSANILLNLLVNNGSSAGKSAPKIRDFLVGQGVQAEDTTFSGHRMLVIYDPSIILYKKHIT